MSFVQSAASSSAVATGVAGASLTGVTAGNGLVCFAVYQSGTGGYTLTDSSGTPWALWSTVTSGGITVAVFKTTLRANDGTHAVTASFTGGGGAWTYLFEDDSQYGYDSVHGQALTAPGAGNTLVPGATIGVYGETVYQIAVDISHGTTANYTPQYGLYHFVINVTGSDATAGRWRITVDNTLGGSNPGMAPGTSDPTGADTYLVLAMSFGISGASVAVINQTVLIQEDVGPQQRTPYPFGMFFGRTAQTLPGTPLAYMRTSMPPWEHYRDKFATVYPIVEVFVQNTQVPQVVTFVNLWRKTNRLDPPEEELRRFDHGVYFQLVRHYTAQLIGYTVEVPDFNDHPWLEWVHPAPTPESALFPYRRQPVPATPYQFPIMWGQPKPWPVTEELDSVFRKPDVGVLIPWQRPIPPAVQMPSLIGLDEATAIGIILGLGLIFLGSVYEDVIYWPIPPPTPWNPTGPVPAPPRGIVTAQWPLPGDTVQPGTTNVTLILSTGRYFVPDTNTSQSNTPNNVQGSTEFP